MNSTRQQMNEANVIKLSFDDFTDITGEKLVEADNLLTLERAIFDAASLSRFDTYNAVKAAFVSFDNAATRTASARALIELAEAIKALTDKVRV